MSLAFVFLLAVGQVTAPAATPATDSTEPQRVLPPGVIEIQVADLHCKTCAKKVARKLYATPGVKRVRTSLKNNLIVVELQKKRSVEMSRLWAAVIAGKQQPLELRVLDRRLVAKDFPKLAEQTAQAVGVHRARH